jgi:DNA-binding SARP family transcriptional activator
VPQGAADAEHGHEPPAPLAIRCFGRFEVYRDGVAIRRWRRDRARELLKHLVVHGRPMHRESLLDLLWTGVDPVVAARGLRVVLHALRQAVGHWGADEQRDYVVATGVHVLLDPAAPIWVDTRAFLDHLQAADALERQSGLASAAPEYAAAEATYRDDYLIEDLGQQWTVLRREELKDSYLLVVSKLADHSLRIGDTTECIARCHKLLAQDRCREDAYQRLMYCQALLGQRSRALQWYRTCETALREELGVAPGERTRQLYERITEWPDALPPVDWLLTWTRGAVVSRNGGPA